MEIEHDLLRTNLRFLKTSNFVSLEKTITGRLLGSYAALDETEIINSFKDETHIALFKDPVHTAL